MKNALAVFAVGLAVLILLSTSEGAMSNFYSDFASWSAALGGSYIMQDFNGYPHETNLNGVDVLSGVNFTSNMTNVVAFYHSLFAYDGTTRQQGIAYYDINVTLPYCAVSFDVESWDPMAPGPATVEIFFANFSSISVPYYQTGLSEQTPVFFGITSDTAITKIRWHEGPEVTGSGNEEVAFDNLAVSRICIPEPSMITMLGFLLLVGAKRVFRHKA